MRFHLHHGELPGARRHVADETADDGGDLMGGDTFPAQGAAQLRHPHEGVPEFLRRLGLRHLVADRQGDGRALAHDVAGIQQTDERAAVGIDGHEMPVPHPVHARDRQIDERIGGDRGDRRAHHLRQRHRQGFPGIAREAREDVMLGHDADRSARLVEDQGRARLPPCHDIDRSSQ